MIRSDIRSIEVNPKTKIIKVATKYHFMHVISYAPETLTPEQRPHFECQDFWDMLEKLCKKHKLAQYAPSPSLEEDFQLIDILEYLFDVTVL